MGYFGIPFRNGVPIGLGSVVSFGAQQFDPSELFVGGTAGAWYDPSDLTTLFTTSAGTTQCAMPGQGSAVSVGLMLDKSQGLVLGSELVTNGDFSNGTTGWTAYQSTLSAVGGKLRITATGGAPGAYQSISVVTGKTYKVTFEIDVGTVGGGSYFVGNTLFGGVFSIPSSGTYTFNLTSGTTNAAYLFYIHRNSGASGGQYFDIDNVSIKELAGNHAIAFNDTTARPELRARVNLLTYSEEFDNGAWTRFNLNAFGSGSVANTTATLDPLGGNTADYIQENTSNGQHAVYNTTPFSLAATQHTASIYAKAAERNWLIVNLNTASSDNRTWFDLSNGTVGTNAAGNTAQIVDVGNGWYKCSVTRTTATGNSYFQPQIANADGSFSYTGTGTSGIYIWGADLRPANIGANVPAYQRIADANTYDTSGFPLYLRFDGVDDSMYTPANLNLSGTDKVSVFAGVRKLSDAAIGFIAELSQNFNSNNGSFLAFPNGNAAAPANTFASTSRGAAGAAPNQYAISAATPAPVTNVFTVTHDIPGDLSAIRLNGAASGTNGTGDKGAGNFGTYPLFIGSRNNASFFLNGHLHSLIIAGSAVSAGNISATEQWVANKTGIVIP